MKKFEKKLEKTFDKKKDLFTQSRALKKTGSHPHQIKKWLPEMVRLHKLRKVNAYFLGCSPNELIVQDFGFGDVVICPKCNSEILCLLKGLSKVVCEKCGAEYDKDEKYRWRMIQSVNNWGALSPWGALLGLEIIVPYLLLWSLKKDIERSRKQITEGFKVLIRKWAIGTKIVAQELAKLESVS